MAKKKRVIIPQQPSDLGPDIRFQNKTNAFDPRSKIARARNPCPTLLHLMANKDWITREELAAGLKFQMVYTLANRQPRVTANLAEIRGGTMDYSEQVQRAKEELDWILTRIPLTARDPLITVAGLDMPLGAGLTAKKLLRTALGTVYGLYTAKYSLGGSGAEPKWVTDIVSGAV